MTSTFEVIARREGKWWFFEIPDIDMSGQARTLSEAEFEATDIIATWLQLDPSTISVAMDIEVPAEIRATWDDAKRREAVARDENAAAARLAREAVGLLRAQGMSQADVARILGVSVQRVSQLEAGRRASSTGADAARAMRRAG